MDEIVDAISISERPASAEDRAVPGHWEGYLLFGSGGSQIATLVEGQTRYVMLIKVATKDTETVINALIKHARKLPPRTLQVTHLGSWQRDGRSQAIYPSYGYTSLLLRSAESVATRDK